MRKANITERKQALQDLILGKKIQKITGDDLMADFFAVENESEILVVSSTAQLKVSVLEISSLGRGAQGSKTIKLKETDRVISLSKI